MGWGLGALGAIFLAGSVLAWVSAVRPADMPVWGPWDFSWLVFLGTTLGAWCYGRGLVRTQTALRPGRWRQVSYFAGIGLIYAVLQTGFENAALHMFFFNRVQHMVMHHLGPFLIALAWPGETLALGMPPSLRTGLNGRWVRRSLDIVQQPVPAGVLFAGLIFLWLTPPVHVRAMLDPTLYTVMNASMVIDGLLFWSLILDPSDHPPARLSFAARLVLVMAVQMPQIMAGAAIALAGRDLYPSYALCGRWFAGIDAVIDQQIGGFIVFFPGAMMSSIAGLLLFRRLWAAEAASVSGPAAI